MNQILSLCRRGGKDRVVPVSVEFVADDVHGGKLGVGERVGNAPMDQLLVNLKLMGWIENDLSRVKEWFDSSGAPALRGIENHYPSSSYMPEGRVAEYSRQWGAVSLQRVLDVALAWSVINSHLDVADFLLQHVADINPPWSSTSRQASCTNSSGTETMRRCNSSSTVAST